MKHLPTHASPRAHRFPAETFPIDFLPSSRNPSPVPPAAHEVKLILGPQDCLQKGGCERMCGHRNFKQTTNLQTLTMQRCGDAQVEERALQTKADTTRCVVFETPRATCGCTGLN